MQLLYNSDINTGAHQRTEIKAPRLPIANGVQQYVWQLVCLSAAAAATGTSASAEAAAAETSSAKAASAKAASAKTTAAEAAASAVWRARAWTARRTRASGPSRAAAEEEHGHAAVAPAPAGAADRPYDGGEHNQRRQNDEYRNINGTAAVLALIVVVVVAGVVLDIALVCIRRAAVELDAVNLLIYVDEVREE